jgi:CelD/BcsL family acetyltransferase involved in cellulose biosynthesis
MKLEIIRDEAGLRALQPFWDKLLEQSATPTPFLRWDWISLWWEQCRTEFSLTIAVIRNASGEPDAIAPLVIGHESDGARRHLRQLGFINGLGALQGERLDFIVRQGREAEFTPLLCEVLSLLRDEWDGVRLNKVPEESPNYPLLVEALHACGRGAAVLNRTECRFIQLPQMWSDYEKRQNGNWRRKMRKRWEVLMAESGAQLAVAGREMPAEAAMEEFLALHALHWPAEVSSFLREPALSLHKKLAAKWIPEGRAFLPCITVNDRLIAGIYGLACGEDLLQYQLGWNPEYARLGLGNLSMRWSVECAMHNGFRRYDMLPGDYEYKESWCHTSRYVVDLECFHPLRAKAAVFQVLRSLKRHIAPSGADQPAGAPEKSNLSHSS